MLEKGPALGEAASRADALRERWGARHALERWAKKYRLGGGSSKGYLSVMARSWTHARSLVELADSARRTRLVCIGEGLYGAKLGFASTLATRVTPART
jgi:hypothetical protein